MGHANVPSMPTIKDRVQVLLEPQEWADLQVLRKEERRSAAAMAAVLISEAIAARKLNGTFVPEVDIAGEELERAKKRRLSKQLGKGVNGLEEKVEENPEMSAADLLKAMQKLINPD